MVYLCTVWVVTTNVYLFLIIQGSYSSWFSISQCQRIVTYGLIVRSVLTCYVTCWPSIRQSYQEGAQIMPIPPNRENIESVEMVLHIPIAVDYFYDFLLNREVEEEIHIFALYIDLRMYDKACSDNEAPAERRNIATDIFDHYFKEEANLYVSLDPQVTRKFSAKFSQIDREEMLNEYLFIEVYAFVLDKLREFYSDFKKSDAFRMLEDEIKKQEKLYEILSEANLW
jgi:sulfur relay (sulfurtransferase) DsrC/TusE family protein